jgi:hypothetical protein
MGQRRSQRAVLPLPHGAAASYDTKSEEISATATLQEETRIFLASKGGKPVTARES